MDGTIKYSHISDWLELISHLSLNGQSVALGLFNLQGQLIEANESMCFFMDTTIVELHPKNSFVNPTFSTIVETVNSGTAYEGFMTIGNYGFTSYTLLGKAYLKGNYILVFVEADVPDLFEENKKMSSLNQEVNNLQRQLIKEKRNLQLTLSELKETQQMLIHSEKMNAMGKLVAGVAHELNNPISFVYSNLFSLEKYIKEVYDSYTQVEALIAKNGNETLTAEVAQIRKKNEIDFLMEDIADMAKESKIGTERVKTIVEDLRRFSRLDESDVKQIDLMENIKSTISITKAEINKKNINFELSGPETLIVDCFPGQLNQAILNVLINAIQAVSEEGQVSLTVRKENENIIILAKDDGSGIPEAIKQRIFEPFFTTKPVGSGTGLGLSLAYKIICDLHKGSIQVESAINRGTTFTITIPVKISNT
ncbi:MAG: sensor histidine kinase [Prolixibacteraceae bacterium]